MDLRKIFAYFAEAMSNAQGSLGLHLWGLEENGDENLSLAALPFADAPESIIAAVTVYSGLVRQEMKNFC